MNENKLHSIEVSRLKWNVIVWTPILIGLIMFSVFNYLVQMSLTTGTETVYLWLSAVGFLLIGFGFGSVYARLFKIEGIDG